MALSVGASLTALESLRPLSRPRKFPTGRKRLGQNHGRPLQRFHSAATLSLGNHIDRMGTPPKTEPAKETLTELVNANYTLPTPTRVENVERFTTPGRRPSSGAWSR